MGLVLELMAGTVGVVLGYWVLSKLGILVDG